MGGKAREIRLIKFTTRIQSHFCLILSLPTKPRPGPVLHFDIQRKLGNSNLEVVSGLRAVDRLCG
jgi:hypothetical protein